jgi:two-component sensor histidine kinase
LVENLSDPVARLDRESRILYINPVVANITGLLPEHFIGKTSRELEIRFVRYILDLTEHLFDIYNVNSGTIKLNLDVDNIYLALETAISCGLIINELVTNALKYAFPDRGKGEIEVKFYCDINEKMTLIVRDNGIGIPDKFDINTASSLGMTLVQGLVEQLEGSLELDRSQGTEFRITFPGNVA